LRGQPPLMGVVAASGDQAIATVIPRLDRDPLSKRCLAVLFFWKHRHDE
jgi:hypothetical protein